MHARVVSFNRIDVCVFGQVVHHLFPGICHTHYPALAPIVRRTAAEFGLTYRCFPSFWAALAAHFRHLAKVGVALHVPSLATVG